MLKNHLVVALRRLRRQRGYTAINVAGLAVGLASCLMIGLYLADEWRTDRFNEHADAIYRLQSAIFIPTGDTLTTAQAPGPAAPAMEADFPEVAEAVRLIHSEERYRVQGGTFHETEVLFVDASFFDVFSYPLLYGDTATALEGPNRLLLSEETARALFGEANPIGQTLEDADGITFTVTGVTETPGPSHIAFDALGSMGTLAAVEELALVFENWLSFPAWTYVRLEDGASAEALAAKLPDFLQRHAGTRIAEGMGGEGMSGGGVAFSLTPLTDIYLGTADVPGPIGPVGNPTYLRAFAFVALFVLLIACINFTNLATARAVERAKEVGVRKTLGAHRGLLARQFLTEALLLSALAVVLAVGLVAFALPAFRQFTGATLVLNGTEVALAGAALAGVSVVVGLLAGAYPALVLSGFQPAPVLRGRFHTSGQGAALRKGLVVVQFGVSVLLIVGTAVVFRQLDYLRSQDLGVEMEQTLVLDFAGHGAPLRERSEAIKEAFLRLPGVRAATASSRVPGSGLPMNGMQVEGATGELVPLGLPILFADADFIPQYGIGLAAGRSFSPDFPADSANALVLNAAATRHLGYTRPEDAVGVRFEGQGREGTVVGVTEDFHVASLHRAVEPMGMWIRPADYRFLSLKVAAVDLPRTLAGLEAVWQRVVPGHPFTYSFLDERFDEAYAADERFGQLVGAFAALAIIVACLGLLGLVAFTTQQRTKEIGVRKVLGASVTAIVALLTRDFLKLIAVAFVVAVPVAWFAMSRWLEGFAYRIEIGPGVFLVAGVLTVGVALMIVTGQALRAASANPIQNLRSE